MNDAMLHVFTFRDEIAISVILIGTTIFFHAIVIALAGAFLRWVKRRAFGLGRVIRDAVLLTMLGLVLIGAHSAEMALWGAALVRLGGFPEFEPAFYFASVSYTTLGYGDLLLPEDMRLLSGSIAANGLLLFGMSAAFLVETTSRLRVGDA
jgi:hypothetical protein